jgi:hypothetical protein
MNRHAGSRRVRTNAMLGVSLRAWVAVDKGQDYAYWDSRKDGCQEHIKEADIGEKGLGGGYAHIARHSSFANRTAPVRTNVYSEEVHQVHPCQHKQKCK